MKIDYSKKSCLTLAAIEQRPLNILGFRFEPLETKSDTISVWRSGETKKRLKGKEIGMAETMPISYKGGSWALFMECIKNSIEKNTPLVGIESLRKHGGKD